MKTKMAPIKKIISLLTMMNFVTVSIGHPTFENSKTTIEKVVPRMLVSN